MTSPEDIYVLWGDGSPPCMSILITLEEKKLQGYRHKCLSFQRQEHKNPEVLELNPRGELPVCKIGDMIMCESLAVCKYLDEKNSTSGASLSCNNLEDNAMMWQKLTEFYWNFPRRCYKDYIRYILDTKPEERDDKEVKKRRLGLITEFKIWEDYFKKTKKDGPYVMGSQFTLADVIIFPWIAVFVALDLDLAASSLFHMKDYYTSLMTRPSIVNSFPKYWEGFPYRSVLTDMHQYISGAKD